MIKIDKQGKDLILRDKQPLSWNEIYNMPGDPEFQLERKDNCLPQTRDVTYYLYKDRRKANV